MITFICWTIAFICTSLTNYRAIKMNQKLIPLIVIGNIVQLFLVIIWGMRAFGFTLVIKAYP